MRALNFADTAPAWEELQAMVEARQRELNAAPADLETVGGRNKMGFNNGGML